VTLSLHDVIKVNFEYENELMKENAEEWPCVKYQTAQERNWGTLDSYGSIFVGTNFSEISPSH